MSTTKHEVYQQILCDATATVTYTVRPFRVGASATEFMCVCAQVSDSDGNKTTSTGRADHLHVFDSCLCVVHSRSVPPEPPCVLCACVCAA